ncbi:hypothetical protein Poli38472_008093 [Pythium oligandrum]|uniref:Uncharacterized protein n=1 Tax=Pythium oligandrum TaxID=41045 RepID=A0A8K1CKT8_PYTOL|nr:hypothetical protein Poli38472_008093 [Pythium oligandrum]|eukprot:TMW65451.1 hypothetical protein Poli38472_008093 [Pythium oligandrum]
MQTFEEEGRKVLKKQRLCAEQIHRHLDLLLTEVETAKAQLVEKQDEYKRKKSRSRRETEERRSNTNRDQIASDSAEAAVASAPCDVEEVDDEIEHIVQEFVERVKVLNLDKSIADELKGLHVALSKYGKQIDKLFSNDVTKICHGKEPDHRAVCQLVAEYLYHNGQIAAADALCKEAEIDLPTNYRECFVELHDMTSALKHRDMSKALEWAKRNHDELQALHIDIEFELVRLKYLDLLEGCSDVMEAVEFAGEALSPFQATHQKEIGQLMGCVLYKGRFGESPYKEFFSTNRWDNIRESVIRACCRLRQVPHRAYLDTCLSVGIAALPAMRKLVAVMDSKMTDWEALEELPVELPIANEHRFHTVFACPVSKEESTPSNPPMLLKCGHVICKSCVKKISFNMTRRFKCPTCPMEQTEAETRELIF